MLGAYAHTLTKTLTSATFPYTVKITDLDFEHIMRQVPKVVRGVDTQAGYVNHRDIAKAYGLSYQELKVS